MLIVQFLLLTLGITSKAFTTPRIHRIAQTALQSTLANTQGTTWKFKGHDIYTESSKPKPSLQSIFKPKPSIILIHGFGCSTTYWRATAASLLSNGYEVHAIDLLGQGQSSKPGRNEGIEYSIDLWAELVDSYAQEHVKGDVVLVGNSLGSLVTLSASTGAFSDELTYLKDKVKGICMFNCGVGLNSRGIAREPRWNAVQKLLIDKLYDVFVFLIFNNLTLLKYVLEDVVTPELLGNTLLSLYKVSPERVDEELIQSFYKPSQDEGSVEALSQIYCNDPGLTPYQLHELHDDYLRDLPIHLVWGDNDDITPLQGGVGQFYLGMGGNVSFDIVEGGHVPFDDNPDESNGSFLRWLNDVIV